MPDSNQSDASATIQSPRKSKSTPYAPSVDFVLAPKGGVGKSATARLLAEYRKESGAPLQCADTDPHNATFSSVKSLGAVRYPAMDIYADELDGDALSALFSRVISEESSFVIDNGAASFQPICNYMLQFGLFDLLAAAGKTVTVHVPFTAPEALDSATALLNMIRQFPSSVRFVAWINEHDGAYAFEKTPFYEEHASRIHGVIRIKRLNPRTNGGTMVRLLADRLAFGDVASSDQYNMMEKLMLSMTWESIKLEMAKVL